MRVIAALGLAAIALGGAAEFKLARAADLAPYAEVPAYTQAQPQFEFGTGWYLRGDASFGPEDQSIMPTLDFNHHASDWHYGVGGGFGYKLTSFFRSDITADYLQPLSASAAYTTGTGTGVQHVSFDRYVTLVNGYLDLGTWYGFSPYVGAGAGFNLYDPSASTVFTATDGTVTSTRLNAADRMTFAWAVMAGVSYAVDPNILVDLGYRHLDLGRYASSVEPYSFSHTFTRDEVRLGLRYMLY